MSAIFGILRFDGATVASSALERMSNALAHRGPDGRKSVADGPAGLGHCLMRVNREDVFEAQPLSDRSSGLTLVADLRLDNRDELAAHFGIGTAALRDMPDSALLMQAYKTWGEACAEHLLGDFTFAIWDRPAGKLVIARDHMGMRYLHHHVGRDFFAFATEIKALWAIPEVPRQLSETQLARHLVMQFTGRDNTTFFDGIGIFPGGSVVTVGARGGIATRRYWEPRDDPIHRGKDEDYYIKTYRSVLTEAVECRIRRLIAPPALLLSAGYDSAAIAGLSGPVLSTQRRKLIAISAVMPEDYAGPRKSARRWVEYCRRDMPHLDVRYYVRGQDTLYNNVERTFTAADGIPYIWYIFDGLFRIAARSGARLIMDGNGGDDTINPRVGNMLQHFLRKGMLRRFATELAAHRNYSRESWWRIFRSRLAIPFAPLWVRRLARNLRHRFAPTWAGRMIAPPFAIAKIKSGAVNLSNLKMAAAAYVGPRNQMLHSLRDWAARHRRNNSNEAAAHGLEFAMPFRDKRVVEFALAIPEELYVKNGQYRYLACRALADVYPPEFQERRIGEASELDPGMHAMVAANLPLLHEDIERMSRNPNITKYIDLDSARRALADVRTSASLTVPMRLALRAIYAAKYVAWFRGDNA